MTTKQFRAWLKVRLDNLSARTKYLSSPRRAGKLAYQVDEEALISDLEETVRSAKARRKLIK